MSRALRLGIIFTLMAATAMSQVVTVNVQNMDTYRLGVLGKGSSDQKIIGTTYHWDIYRCDLDGRIEWTNKTNGFCFDLKVSDVDLDGREEILAACGDDTLYCFSGWGDRLWAVGLNSGPVFSVDVINHNQRRYILAGTVLNDLFVLSNRGEVIDKRHMSGAVRQIDVCDFNKDGEEEVYVCLSSRSDIHTGYLLEYPSLTQYTNTRPIDLKISRDVHGQNTTIAEDEKGRRLIFYNGGYIDPLKDAQKTVYDNKGFDIIKDEYASAYRSMFLSSGRYLEEDDGQYVIGVYGDDVYLYSTAGRLRNYVRSTVPFNDVITITLQGRDVALFAGAPNGDDNLYMVTVDKDDKWLRELAELKWSGSMERILKEYDHLSAQLAEWNGTPVPLAQNEPLVVQIDGQQANGMTEENMSLYIERMKQELAYYRKKFPYPDRIKFAFRIQLYERFDPDYRIRKPDGSWIAPGKDKDADKRLSKAAILRFARMMEKENIPFYTKAHGIQVSLSTYKEMIDAAPNACLGIGIVEYDFLYDPDGVFPDFKGKADYFVKDFVLPLMDYCLEKKKKVWFHCKNAVWPLRTQYAYMQKGVLSQKYKDVIILSNEDSNSRTPDLNTAARMGAWYAGYVDNWGYRWVSDIPAYSRIWDWSRTNTGHPASRALLTAVSLGANYLNICSRQYDISRGVEMPSMRSGIEQFLTMLGKGIIAPPSRESIRNVSPVIVSVSQDINPNISTGGRHEFVFKEEDSFGYKDPVYRFGFTSKIDNKWGSATTPPYDFTYYVYGRRFSAHNHIPILSDGLGYMPIVPDPVARADVDMSRFKTQITTNLTEPCLNGQKLSLDQAKEVILSKMKEATSDPDLFPVLITGELFSSVTKIHDGHYVIYLVDPYIMSPKGSRASLFINLPGNWALSDRISHERIDLSDNRAQVEVPKGLFRVLEIIRI